MMAAVVIRALGVLHTVIIHFDFVLIAVAKLTVSQMGFPAPQRFSYSSFQCPTPIQQASMLTCPLFGS